MKSNILIAIIILVLSSFSVKSLAGLADLQLEINPLVFNSLEFGEGGTFSITVVNNGPDDAGISVNSDFPIAVFSDIIFPDAETSLLQVSFFPSFSGSECVLTPIAVEPVPGGLPGVIYVFNFPVIPANSSITCEGQFALSIASGILTVAWGVLNNGDIDPNTDNNSVDMIFGIRPEPVPALSLWSIMVMALLMLFVAGVSLRFKSNH